MQTDMAHHVEAVQWSFHEVAPLADLVAHHFYGRLFELAPHVRPLFPEDMTEQRIKLMQTLMVVIERLDRLEEILEDVQALAVDHVKFGAKPAHYDLVGAALLHALALSLGAKWTPTVATSWKTVYDLLAKTMIDAAEASQAA